MKGYKTLLFVDNSSSLSSSKNSSLSHSCVPELHWTTFHMVFTTNGSAMWLEVETKEPFIAGISSDKDLVVLVGSFAGGPNRMFGSAVEVLAGIEINNDLLQSWFGTTSLQGSAICSVEIMLNHDIAHLA